MLTIVHGMLPIVIESYMLDTDIVEASIPLFGLHSISEANTVNEPITSVVAVMLFALILLRTESTEVNTPKSEFPFTVALNTISAIWISDESLILAQMPD